MYKNVYVFQYNHSNPKISDIITHQRIGLHYYSHEGTSSQCMNYILLNLFQRQDMLKYILGEQHQRRLSWQCGRSTEVDKFAPSGSVVDRPLQAVFQTV